ncbi:MAG TPA: ADP-ribosylglycohydrolase family protein [Anaeromyxobacteraceae bacterium]|nr:ADP-ribosylglycohydrolase family protein [Anaeromyxobacteraceae bacterium]
MPSGSPKIDRARARGALIGLAVGDALGTTLEFSTAPAPPFPVLATGPHREMVGGGPFGVAPGQVTDDTQMAVCLATSLLAMGGFDAEDVAARYVEWGRVAFDAGTQTREALAQLERGTPPLEAGRAVWLAATGRPPAANGSLMRTAPIGVRFARDPRARMAASLRDSAITHFDPRCQFACVALNAAIAAALTQRPTEPLALFEQAIAELIRATAPFARTRSVSAHVRRAAVDAILEDMNLALEPDPRLYDSEVHLLETQGFVRVALRLAFWELFQAPSFEAALVDVVNRGGDADTNAAVTGALLGAFWGEEAIPERWRTAVLGALEGQDGPFADTYHPRRLLALAEVA